MNLPIITTINKLTSQIQYARYLTQRKYREYIAGCDEKGVFIYNLRIIDNKQLAEVKKQVTNYHLELLTKPYEQLEKLYKQELEMELDEVRKKDAEIESQRFFNGFAASADFDHWSKASYWTIEEAVALSFGKEPKIVNWKSINQYQHNSAFVQKYGKLKDLVERAKIIKKTSDYMIPKLYLEWVKENEIDFPRELENSVIKRSGKLFDWNAEYQKLAKEFKELLAETLELRKEVKKSAAEMVETKEKPMHKSQLDSMLKIIAGLLVCNYGFDSVRSGETKAKEIIDDILRDSGLEINDDTVRKYMRQALVLLPKSLAE